jgi:dTDP-4-dehydrorhamnose reductase
VRVLVTGAGGMLARALLSEMGARGNEVLALSRADLDVTDEEAVHDAISALRPRVVVQCAAYTAVDRAEEEEDVATRVNALGTRHVARACDRVGALFVYPSTDYVFAGNGRTPYRPDDAPRPVNAYGRSKLAGEAAAREAAHWLVVRTSWLYGEGGPNFVDTVTRLAGEREVLEVVDDQVGRPTWTRSLAQTILELIVTGAEGILHASDAGDHVTWCGFAREILARQGLATPILPVPSSSFPRPAPRPGYSVLDCSGTEAVLGRSLPHWTDTLRQYLRSRAPEGEGSTRPRSLPEAGGEQVRR